MLEIDAGYTASRSLRWRTRRRDGSSVKPTTTSPSAAQLRDIRLPDGRARLETGATKGDVCRFEAHSHSLTSGGFLYVSRM
jgi:hypothetical protein